MPPAPLLISFDSEDIRKQAEASTQRFEKGIANFLCFSLLSIQFFFISEVLHVVEGRVTYLDQG